MTSTIFTAGGCEYGLLDPVMVKICIPATDVDVPNLVASELAHLKIWECSVASRVERSTLKDPDLLFLTVVNCRAIFACITFISYTKDIRTAM